MGFAIAVHLVEQVNVTGQLLCCIFHLIFQLLVLCHARPSGESSPYRLKVNGWVVGPDHRKGMCNGGDGGITVEAFEVLPHHLAPVDDGVRTRRPIVRLRSCLHVDVVKHQPNFDHHGVEILPLGLCL